MQTKSEQHLLEVQAELGAVFNVPVQCFFTGSCEINGEGNDVDVVVQLHQPLHTFNPPEHWELCGTESYESQGMFAAYRVGEYNFIVVDDPSYYADWETALHVCKFLARYGMNSKNWRVAMHRIIVDGFDADEVSL